MIRPVLFGYNEQTAASNSFQRHDGESAEQIRQDAIREFDAMAALLSASGIEAVIFEDTTVPHTPDSVFPNNWISFHENNTIVIYPMMAENRRRERRSEIISHFSNEQTQLIDLSAYEQKGMFLEGTGSIVFDYTHRIAYANTSPRTSVQLLESLCSSLNCRSTVFTATDASGQPVYHTNVLLCIGNTFAVLCSECIPDKAEAEAVRRSLEVTGHSIITISRAQMNAFAGNMYQLFNSRQESFILMSSRAYRSLRDRQVQQLQMHGTLLHTPLDTIERYGGGSARCMIAEVL